MGLLRNNLSPKYAYAAEHLFPSKRMHRRRMIQHYSKFVNQGDLVFDIGANLGERSMVFRALGAKVIAVEPTKYCIQYLKQLFNNDPNVTIIPQALGSEIGTGEININENLPVLSTMSGKWSTESRFSKDYTWEKKEIVSITTLDYLIKEHGVPKFCKIDVEGFEYQVLNGLSSPIPVISFEFLFEFLSDAELCLEKISSLYEAQYNYNIGEEMDFSLQNWSTADIVIESIRSKKNNKLWGDIYARAIV